MFKTSLVAGVAVAGTLALTAPANAQTVVLQYFVGEHAVSAVFADDPGTVWCLDPSSGPTWELSAQILKDAYTYGTKVFHYPPGTPGTVNPCPIFGPGGVPHQIAGSGNRLGVASPQ